jgi:lipopolysaccharide/colanic/teichoic acid biosynthesis glycosyltransferase
MWDGRGRRRWGFIEWLPQTEFARAAPKSIDDPRVTSRFAAVCRRYSIDELPQLWQVFRGEMALVGPRPLTRSELDDHYGADAAELLRRKPGLTGLWQVKGRSRLTYDQRRRLDLFMIRRWSLPLYTRILIATVPCVVAGKDAW